MSVSKPSSEPFDVPYARRRAEAWHNVTRRSGTEPGASDGLLLAAACDEIEELREELERAEDHIDLIMGEIGGTLPG